MADDVTQLNIHYTWWASMNQVIKTVDSIIDKCMVRGERGWPPHSGGIVRSFGGKFSRTFQALPAPALS